MRYVFLIVLVLISQGCAFFKKNPPPDQPVAALPEKPSSPEKFLKHLKVLDEDKFREGGKLLIVPFTAGANVAANEELDRASFMIVKTIADTLDNDSAASRFTVLDAENADSADLILQGRIVAMKETDKLKKFFKSKKYIGIEGKMIDARSGELVFHFFNAKESQDKKATFVDLSVLIGQDLAQFLSTN